jgi:hypothetical protein
MHETVEDSTLDIPAPCIVSVETPHQVEKLEIDPYS